MIPPKVSDFVHSYENDHEDDYGLLMGKLQQCIRLGNADSDKIKDEIVAICLDIDQDSDVRRKCLAVLVCGSCKAYVEICYSLISIFIDSDCEDMQFTALACVSFLPLKYQLMFRDKISSINYTEPNFVRAKKCFDDNRVSQELI